MSLNAIQLSECCNNSNIEKEPLSIKIRQYSNPQNRPNTASSIKNKNLNKTTSSHTNVSRNKRKSSNHKQNNSCNKVSKCTNTTDLLREKYLLRKHCELLRNRIGILMLKEKEVKTKINWKKAQNSSIEKIKQNKEQSKQLLEKYKIDNAQSFLDKKKQVNKAREKQNNNLQRSKENNFQVKKNLYQSFINQKNQTISERLIEGIDKPCRNSSFYTKKHHVSHHSADRTNNDKEILEQELNDLKKAEELFKLRLEQAKEKYKNEILSSPNTPAQPEKKNNKRNGSMDEINTVNKSNIMYKKKNIQRNIRNNHTENNIINNENNSDLITLKTQTTIGAKSKIE